MAERLDWIRHQPSHWMHWHPLSDGPEVHQLVARRYSRATAVLVQPEADRWRRHLSALSGPWWHPSRWRSQTIACSPQQNLPSVGMLWANLMLHTSPDPQALLRQWHELVLPGGFLMLSCLGPDTLREWRDVCAALGWPPPAHEFTDMHDWGDMLLQAGFAEPVMDMERITLSFQTSERLLQELRGLGRNLHRARFPALRGKHWQTQLKQALEERLQAPGSGGGLRFTVEVIYGHAFKSDAGQRQPRSTGPVTLPLDAVRAKLPGRAKGVPGR
jgi:malonyl-CoA O-methyltransferase